MSKDVMEHIKTAWNALSELSEITTTTEQSELLERAIASLAFAHDALKAKEPDVIEFVEDMSNNLIISVVSPLTSLERMLYSFNEDGTFTEHDAIQVAQAVAKHVAGAAQGIADDASELAFESFQDGQSEDNE